MKGKIARVLETDIVKIEETEKVTYIGKLFTNIWKTANEISELENKKYNIIDDQSFRLKRLDMHIIEMLNLYQNYVNSAVSDEDV